ncbi:TetR family transcriptional regulator [Mycobacterium bohemicum DSM 44277]|uniref:TetR family transcriptional regulator n=2 Tax=Mycobacterium bohemicum TaxID=56425 RepID=A0A1X1R8F3_MYCBE|nr:TetR/AcrR family transcriptional regulator [Mycobacterium bohemicum]MCV6971143.1 TetR/AcrR family transcriptional regulator [Mycobacterium bohemicum]ORV01247.1 TetR family transcriptional regulator [Mycobacterium bohemicum]CPR13364.1 TetR family transcriptional regulator [Mycobacterium bohemicum DSM 44277]
MSDPGVRRRTGGRSARVREAVLKVTLQAVAEHGADRVSIGEIARQAEVHETSIYRRWPTKEHLVLDALLDYSEAKLPIPDTGTLRGDLVTFATEVAAYLDSPLGRTLVRSMAVAGDDDTLVAGRARFWESRFDLANTMIARAKERGEVPTDLDAALALELVVAPLHFRALLTRQPIDAHRIAQLVDALLTGLAG